LKFACFTDSCGKEGAVSQRQPDPRIHSRLRLFIDQGLELWYHFLDYRMGVRAALPALAGAGPGRRPDLWLVRTMAFQEQLGNIFAGYREVCCRCGYCCGIWPAPFSRLDCLLFGLSPNGRLVYPAPGFALIATRILKWATPRPWWWIWLGHKGPKPAGSRKACPFLTQQGCGLPLGARPALCLIFLCNTLINNLSWHDYRKYVSITGQYLCFLTRLVRAAALF
jgi:hypothetical protein